MSQQATRERNVRTVEEFFVAGREVDRLSFMVDDIEWWNGLGKFPAAPGQSVFRGKAEVGARILGRAPSPPQPNGRHVDRYDLSTISFHDVHSIADDAYVFRQHLYRATTRGGHPYENVYGFLFHSTAEGLIDRIWEHWGTLNAYETLFQGPLVDHDPDYLLMSTPAVRRRLDLQRLVERAGGQHRPQRRRATAHRPERRLPRRAPARGPCVLRTGGRRAHTIGTDFRPTPRKPAAEVLRWNGFRST